MQIKDVDHAPVAAVGSDQKVAEGSNVTLDGSKSYDPDGNDLTFTWTQTSGSLVPLDLTDPAKPTFSAPFVGMSGETLIFSLIVNDGTLDSLASEVNILVENVNHPPIAEAEENQTRNEGVAVTLDGTGSKDPDTDPITYLWSQVSGTPVTLSDPTAAKPTFLAPEVGAEGDTLIFELVVSDGSDTSQADQVSITILDTNQPPQCSLAIPMVGLLWPPNHKLVGVGITGVTDPENADVRIMVTGVTQDESVNGLGDGDTSPDAVLGNMTLLRAERSGNGNGRVYRINFIASDAQGKSCSGSVPVCVPKDARTTTCVDDGNFYDSTIP